MSSTLVNLSLIIIVFVCYQEADAACGVTEMKGCMTPAESLISDDGLDIGSQRFSENCNKVTDAKACLTALGCQRPGDDATEETSVNAALVFDLSDDFCSETNKKYILDNQQCLSSSNTKSEINKCGEKFEEIAEAGTPTCNDTRSTQACNHDAFSKCSKGAANALTSFMSKQFNKQLRQIGVSCKLDEIKPPLAACNELDLKPCENQIKTFLDIVKNLHSDYIITSSAVEQRCKAFNDLTECGKRLPCIPKPDKKREPTATYLLVTKIFEFACTEKNKKVLLNTDNQKCMNSDEVRNATMRCQQVSTPHPTATPTSQCKTLNELMRCESNAFTRCDKEVKRIMLFSIYKRIEKKLDVDGSPPCDLEPDLQDIADGKGGVARIALSYLFTIAAMLAAILITT